MKCISTVSLNSGFVQRSKARRSLSPFLNVLIRKVLVLLRDAEIKKNIHGLKIRRNVEHITRLIIEDDSLLFTRATKSEAEHVMIF